MSYRIKFGKSKIAWLNIGDCQPKMLEDKKSSDIGDNEIVTCPHMELNRYRTEGWVVIETLYCKQCNIVVSVSVIDE